MRSRDTAMTPAIERELEALEAALNGDPSADPDLLALVADTRAQRQEIDPGFQANLADRVAAGFPRPAGSLAARLEGLRAHRRQLLPAMGVAATLMAGLVVIGLNAGGDGDDPVPVSRSEPQVDTEGARPGGAAADNALAAPLTAQTAPAPSAESAVPLARDMRGAKATPFGRKVVRSIRPRPTAPASA